MPAATVGITRLGQVAIVVRDLPRAVAFYRDTLGLRFLFEAPPGLAFFDCGGVRLMLTLPEGDGRDNHTSVLYYEVEDLDAAAAAVKAAGVVFEQEPHKVAQLEEAELWMGFLRDPHGNLVALMQER